MNATDKAELIQAIAKLQAGGPELGPRRAEDLLMQVLQPLLAEDGYDVRQTPRAEDGGVDIIARRKPTETLQAQTLGIEFKYYRDRPVGVEVVRSLVGAAILREFDRAILLVNTGFTKQARAAVQRELPLQVELLDLDALRAWTDRLDVDTETVGAEVQAILRAVSSTFASIVARNPEVLRELEWRDVERMIAEVFDGLGFSVTLTPPSKDGGKDVVLECTVQGRHCVYVVEVKHWRSKTRVGGGALREFLNVIARETRDGGLFLSTYGYCDNAFEQLSEIERRTLRFGDKSKVVALCRTYEKARSGIWSPPERLDDVLYDGTE